MIKRLRAAIVSSISFHDCCFEFISLLKADKLHIKYQCGICWNNAWVAPFSIAIIRSASDPGSFSYTHLGNAFIPTFDHLAPTNLKPKRLSPVSGRIKFLSILQDSCIVHNSNLASLWEGTAITFLQCFNGNALVVKCLLV